LFDNNNGDILLKLLGKERGVWSERRASWELLEQINRKEEPPVTLNERERGRERRLF
jgi:hypothetical protein